MQVDEDEEDLKIENEFESEIVTDVKDDEAADSGVSTEEVHVERKLRDFSELMDDEDDDENVDQNVLDKFDKLMDETAVKLPPVLTGNQKYLVSVFFFFSIDNMALLTWLTFKTLNCL